MGLRWWLRVCCSWASPLLSVLGRKKTFKKSRFGPIFDDGFGGTNTGLTLNLSFIRQNVHQDMISRLLSWGVWNPSTGLTCWQIWEKCKLEINMHHLRGAMQYHQTPWAIFWAIFTKLGMRRMSQVRSLTPNFTVVYVWNVGLQASKSPKLAIFGINFPHKGISPYTIFTKFGVVE